LLGFFLSGFERCLELRMGDDPKEPIEAFAHIDGLGVQIDWNRGVRSKHLF
jgi:hypothetical protein